MKMMMIRPPILLLLFLFLFVSSEEEGTLSMTEEEKNRAIRMKTTSQLKKIFHELAIPYKTSMTKNELQEIAYDSNALEEWWKIHPEKRPKSKAEKEWLDRHMKADYSDVQDPEKRRIMESLTAKGIKVGMGGSANEMSLKDLQEIEKVMESVNTREDL